MRKILIVLTLFLTLVLIGCVGSSPPYESMTEFETPVQMGICFSGLCILGYEKYWVSHEYVMNETQTLFYAPKSIRINGNVYLNEEECYFIRAGTTVDGYTYERVDLETLKEIFKE